LINFVLDILPDDPGHLVAIEFDDGVGHLDILPWQVGPFWKTARFGRGGMIASAL